MATPGQRFVWPDRVELDPELLGVAGQVENVGDVFAVEPLVLQRLERSFSDPVLAGGLDTSAHVAQLRVPGDEPCEAERSEWAAVISHQDQRGDLTSLCVGKGFQQRRAKQTWQNLAVDIPAPVRITSRSAKGPTGPPRSSSRPAARHAPHRGPGSGRLLRPPAAPPATRDPTGPPPRRSSPPPRTLPSNGRSTAPKPSPCVPRRRSTSPPPKSPARSESSSPAESSAVDPSPHLLIRRRSCPHNRPARKFEAEHHKQRAPCRS